MKAALLALVTTAALFLSTSAASAQPRYSTFNNSAVGSPGRASSLAPSFSGPSVSLPATRFPGTSNGFQFGYGGTGDPYGYGYGSSYGNYGYGYPYGNYNPGFVPYGTYNYVYAPPSGNYPGGYYATPVYGGYSGGNYGMQRSQWHHWQY